MKGVQQRRNVQADFVCKLEKERVDAFEVYPNTVRLNLLNGCPSRSPLRLCCISFVFIYDYRRFSHISVHSKREKNSPTTPPCTVCFLWVHKASSETWIMRISTRPSPAAYTEGVAKDRKEKGVGRGLGRQEKGPSPFSLSSFFSKPFPSPAPSPICDYQEGYQPLSLNTRCLFKFESTECRFPMLGPEVSMFSLMLTRKWWTVY